VAALGVPAQQPVSRVTLLASPGFALQVHRSYGTEPAPGGRGPWRRDARVPRGPWQKLDDRELDSLRARGGARPATTVAFFRPPPSLFRRWRRVDTGPIERFGDAAAAVWAAPDYRDSIAETTAYLRSVSRYGAAPLECYVAETHASQKSVCWDSKEFVGLHLDTRARTPLAECAFSPTRFCLNVGEHPRGFQFFDVPIDEMFRRLAAAGHDVSRRTPPPEIADRFLQAHPDYPVNRVTLRPGDAYLAPTDNIVHDGFTEDVPPGACDLVVMAIGYFDPGTVASPARPH